jgi:hypothetical protein
MQTYARTSLLFPYVNVALPSTLLVLNLLRKNRKLLGFLLGINRARAPVAQGRE